jgi:hypothetical protein
MKNLYLAALFICSAFNLQSQSIERSVLAPTGGDFFDGGNIYVDYTVGEITVTTLGNLNNTLTQGFQQPFSNTYFIVEPNTSNPVQVLAYPNPVVDQLNISIENAKLADYRVMLFDVLGQLLFDENIQPGFNAIAQISINLNSFSSGNYYLRVLSDKHLIQTGKIIKINQ